MAERKMVRMRNFKDFYNDVIFENEKDVYNKTISYALSRNEETKEYADNPWTDFKYTIGQDLGPGSNSLQGRDLQIWKALYPVKPPKIGKEIGSAGSAGSGNGEIALYWLFKSNGYNVVDGREDEKPDLIVNNVGVEVKSYGKSSMTLGRFGRDKDSRIYMSTVLGVDALLNNLKGEKRVPSIDTVNNKELFRSFQSMAELSNNEGLRKLSADFPVIGNIYKGIDNLISALGLSMDFTPKEGSVGILKKILKTKLSKKPGFGGFMTDVTSDGKIINHQVLESDIDDLPDDNVLQGVYINGAAVNIKTAWIFGKK